MSELPMPTMGQVYAHIHRGKIRIYERNTNTTIATTGGCGPRNVADGMMIVAAFNAATEARAMGFDPIGAVQQAANSLQSLEDLYTFIAESGVVVADSKYHLVTNAAAVLAAARTRKETP